MRGDRGVRQEIDALSVQAVRLPKPTIIGGGHDNTPFCVFPKNREESVAQRPAGHRQLSDYRRPFHMVRIHQRSAQHIAACGIVNVASMVMEVGEDFRKEFNRKLENCTTRVRYRSKERDGNPNTHFRWSEPVGPFGLGGPPLSTPFLAASLSRAVRERLGTGEVSMAKGRSE